MAREKLSNGLGSIQYTGRPASQPQQSSFLKPAIPPKAQRPSSSLPLSKSHVDESHAVVINGGVGHGTSQEAMVGPMSDEEEEKEEEEEGAERTDEEPDSDVESSASDNDEAGILPQPKDLANGKHILGAGRADVTMQEAEHMSASEEVEGDVITEEPTFGDLAAAQSAKPISITESLPFDSGTLVPTESTSQVAIPSGVSLSTVLTQALRTNDNSLLESCFHNTDNQTIRTTIQRLDPSYAGILMQKLAERLSTRPGRCGNLLVWVQWICVAHGGAIAGRPDVLSNVNTLYSVLNQRSRALDPLLLLKGKLDMLDAQLDLRRQLTASRGPTAKPREGHVVYVEGEEPNDSSDEDEAMADNRSKTLSTKKQDKNHLGGLVSPDEDDSDDGEEMPLTNGVVAESVPSDSNSEEDKVSIEQHDDGLIDNEAEESDEDSLASAHARDKSEEAGGSDEEDDLEMDDFIDDGPLEDVELESEPSIDDADESPPAAKKRRR